MDSVIAYVILSCLSHALVHWVFAMNVGGSVILIFSGIICKICCESLSYLEKNGSRLAAGGQELMVYLVCE